jgi:hypothetical protein
VLGKIQKCYQKILAKEIIAMNGIELKPITTNEKNSKAYIAKHTVLESSVNLYPYTIVLLSRKICVIYFK